MERPDWAEGLAGAVTVCDRAGTILYLNERARETFAADGGGALVGRDLFACHPEPARSRLRALLATGRSNAYTITKRGRRKLIYQAPWRAAEGSFGGLVELSLELPAELPHFDRDSQED